MAHILLFITLSQQLSLVSSHRLSATHNFCPCAKKGLFNVYRQYYVYILYIYIYMALYIISQLLLLDCDPDPCKWAQRETYVNENHSHSK